MKTSVQKKFQKSICQFFKVSLILALILFSKNNVIAQPNSVCLVGPQAATFQPLFSFLNLNNTNMVTATIWEYESTSLTLDAVSIGNNMLRLRRVGSLNYLRADVVGNSCLRARNISMRRILDGTLQNVSVRMFLAPSGGPGLPVTQETVVFNNISYNRVQTIGTGATRTHLFRNTTVANRFLLIDFQN